MKNSELIRLDRTFPNAFFPKILLHFAESYLLCSRVTWFIITRIRSVMLTSTNNKSKFSIEYQPRVTFERTSNDLRCNNIKCSENNIFTYHWSFNRHQTPRDYREESVQLLKVKCTLDMKWFTDLFLITFLLIGILAIVDFPPH